MTDRKLVTLRHVDKILEITGADKIELAIVDGWQCVVKKGEFKEGDRGFFFEIDSLVPSDDPRFAFLEPKFRVKTIRLRGQLSQGLMMPMSILTEDETERLAASPEMDDFTDFFNVQKYEVPSPMGGQQKGTFPTHLVPKTDQERVQNLSREILGYTYGQFEVTEKLDGCHPYNAHVHLWDGGRMKIGEIVNQKLTPTLVGMDQDGNLVPSKVLDHYNNGRKSNWLDIYVERSVISGGGNHSKRIRITDNHEVWTGEWCEAKTLQSGDSLKFPVKAISDNALRVIRDSLLGDGSLHSTGSNFAYSESHKADHGPYVEYLQQSLGNVAKGELQKVTSGYGSNMIRVNSIQNYLLTQLYHEWYPNGRKTIPNNLSWMDDASVAKWYMDDGSLSHHEGQRDRACFATNGFSKDEVDRLGARLTEMYGVSTTTYFSKGWTLRVNAGRDNSIANMWHKIAPWIVPCMRYKLPAQHQDTIQKTYPIGGVIEQLEDLIVIDVQQSEYIGVGYDIHTETENYVCQNAMVHNCSCTIWHHKPDIAVEQEGYIGVASRNWEMSQYGESVYNAMLEKYDLKAKLTSLGRNLAIQGEIIGPKIQNNKYKLATQELHVFDIYDIDKQQYLGHGERRALTEMLDLPHVPIIEIDDELKEKMLDLNSLLNMADGKSKLADVPREGLVFKHKLGQLSFKAISNKWLLHHKA